MTIKELAAIVETQNSLIAELKSKLEAASSTSTTSPRPMGRRRREPMMGLGLVTNGVSMQRMQFQDWLFEQNEIGFTTVGADGEKYTTHLTDKQIAILNNVEHPQGIEITLRIVKIMRDLYNEGKHSKFYGVPKTPSRQYGLNAANEIVAVA